VSDEIAAPVSGEEPGWEPHVGSRPFACLFSRSAARVTLWSRSGPDYSLGARQSGAGHHPGGARPPSGGAGRLPRTTDSFSRFARMRSRLSARHSAPMSALQSPHHVSKRWAVLLVVGVVLALLGVLWFLQGAGVVHVRPILCVSNCKPVTKSVGWLIAGAVGCVAGIAIATASARHLRRR